MYSIKKNKKQLIKVETVPQAVHAICDHKGQPASDLKISEAKTFFANTPKATYNFDEDYTVERAQI